jgi:hypothetical protein
MERKITLENLLNKANIIHNNKYEYLFDEIINSKSKINIVCKIHGVFNQRIEHHLKGSGCPKCVGRNKNNSELIDLYKKIHKDKYDYSLVDYKNAKTKIKIICPKHGIFEITSRQHLNGVNCGVCERNRISFSQRKTNDEFIRQSKSTHGDIYDYSLVNYSKANTPVTIICKKHGKFNQIPRTHIQGSGCPICKESKGEREIRLWLIKNGIQFISQHKFPNCKNIKPLPFDFYLPHYNMCIEYQGEQHYTNKNLFGGKNRLNYIKTNDEIKLNYCLINNLDLCTISYKEFNNIELILQKNIST